METDRGREARREKEEEPKPDELIKERAALWQMMHGAGGIDPPPLPQHSQGEKGDVWAVRCMETHVCVCARVWSEKYSCATALMEKLEPPACWQMTCQCRGGEKKRSASD